MFSQDDDGQSRMALALVFGLVAVVVGGVVGFAVYRLGAQSVTSFAALPAKPAAVAVPKVPAPPDAAIAAQAASDSASIKVEYGVVKFYFASGRADLAAGAAAALVDLVKGAKDGRKLVISGFHDASGGAARNAELAKQRALAVSAALQGAGVPARQIELRKPEQMAVTTSDSEARRVEVMLQ